MSHSDRPSRSWGASCQKLLQNSRICLFIEMTTYPCTYIALSYALRATKIFSSTTNIHIIPKALVLRKLQSTI
jgi:hypothetical protein